jgi:hypothetical protein
MHRYVELYVNDRVRIEYFQYSVLHKVELLWLLSNFGLALGIAKRGFLGNELMQTP